MMMSSNLTPAMKQYFDVKNKHEDCIVLFRMGDFYETFYDDAKLVSEVLDITLTARGKGEKKAPLAGLPYHALEPHLAKLIRAGHKVAIVEQLEDPKKAKGIVKRGVVRIVTQGTVTEESLLESSSNNYLLVFNKEKEKCVLAYCDLSTGDFFSVNCLEDQLLHEIARINPSEIVYPLSLQFSDVFNKLKEMDFTLHAFDDRHFEHGQAKKVMLEHFDLEQTQGLGYSEKDFSISCLGALISYLYKTQLTKDVYLKRPKVISSDEFMRVDLRTCDHLELVKSQSGSVSLFKTIDYTKTAMGKRRLKQWILRPLLKEAAINKRLEATEHLIQSLIKLNDLQLYLSQITDLERITTRIIHKQANPKDLVSMKESLKKVPQVQELIESIALQTHNSYLKELCSFALVDEIVQLIDMSVTDEPPTVIRDGNMIKEGYNEKLDELRQIRRSVKEFLYSFEEKERERTGIKSLKVKFNRVFGYFIEVTKTHLDKVPSEYVRKQTQANSERFITQELKEKESLILSAVEKSKALEYDLYMDLLDRLGKFNDSLKEISYQISVIDCLQSFAKCALELNYARPQMTEKRVYDISGGRHAVLDKKYLGQFVPNDCYMKVDARTHIITGPNMAGKSTYLRQLALIVLLAHMGSFVPAKRAVIGLTDQIFTRIGASDKLSIGMSTFMVEMVETAYILNNATERSLVLLDEIGRGTSTYDGFALAWGITEHLHTKVRSMSLFATHYHQLNDMANRYEGIENYNVMVKEEGEDITFLHKIVKGGTDKSYGIHVAKIAGLPKDVLFRAKKIMKQVSSDDSLKTNEKSQVVKEASVGLDRWV